MQKTAFFLLFILKPTTFYLYNCNYNYDYNYNYNYNYKYASSPKVYKHVYAADKSQSSVSLIAR